MKKYLSLLLAVILAVLPVCAGAEGFSTNPDMIEKAALSVLKLMTFDASGNPIATGSGFVIFDNITLVTNYHVIHDAFSIKAESDEGYEYYITGIKIADKAKDIAIMQFSAPTVMKPLDYSIKEIRRGERVAAIGSPVGLKNTFSTGNVSYVYTEDNVRWIQITAPISHGSSGGALFNEAGEVIGVTSATRSDGQNINFAINISEAVDLYNAWDGTVIKLGHQVSLAEELSKLGDKYYKGEDVKKDYETALGYYREAAEYGYPHAIYMLGECYYYGDGVQEDKQKAIEYYQQASEKDDPDAIYSLGWFYSLGEGLPQDEYKARDLLIRAVDLQSTKAMVWLGRCYAQLVGYNGTEIFTIESNYTKAFSLFEKAASLGNSSGMAWLGYCYDNKIGTSRNVQKAFDWYSKSAEAGNTMGMYFLAQCYEYGIGTKINYEKMVEWYNKAADLDDISAMRTLADFYYRGGKVKKDLKKAYDLVLKAAKLEDLDCLRLVGVCYENGYGIDKNISLAEEWYKKAIEAGDETAQICLDNLKAGISNIWAW